jgi:hypothetical protein
MSQFAWREAKIKFSEDWVNQALACPHCGSACLHHGAVRSYDRPEDADLTTVTTLVKGRSVTEHVDPGNTRNPSVRRHGLAVAFACEGCHSQLELTLAQQKGATLIEWRFVPADFGKEMRPDIDYPTLQDEPPPSGPLHPTDHFVDGQRVA